MKRFLTFAFACFPLMCIGAPSISYTSYFNNVHVYTNITLGGVTRNTWPSSGVSGTVINTGASAVGAVPVYTDTTGTNVAPSATFNLGTSTNATLTGNLLANGGVLTNGITAGASTFTGAVGFADGDASNPSISWTSDQDGSGTGFFRAAANRIGVSLGGTADLQILSGTFAMKSTEIFGWCAGTVNNSPDTILVRDGAANTLALRNGTAAQAFRVYNTFTDASNHEYGVTGWSGNRFFLSTVNAGTGVARDTVVAAAGSVTLRTVSSDRWNINTSGHFLAAADNTYDIGASGATRPRNVYAAGFLTVSSGTSFINQLQVSATSGYIWQTRSRMLSPADGVIELVNNAETDFGRLQFGGTTTNFNAIAAVTNVAGKPYLKFTDATGANLRKIVNVGHQGGYTNVLSDAVATSVFYIAVPSTNIVAGKVVYEIAATDGTDTQGISGECKFVAVGKSTTVTAQIADVQTTAAASAGTLTTAVAANVATNNVLAITIDANTSLTTTNLVAKWRVESAGLFDVNQVIP